MLAIQTYLRQSENTLETLKRDYAIKSKRHNSFNNLVCLKYSQIESPFSEEIVCECRGIILDESNDWAVVSYPYNKFFNHGEQLAAEIDWTTATFVPKLDGSLMTLYFYQGEWLVQSSGTADGGGQVGDFNITFAELFWQVFKEEGYTTEGLDCTYCYMFELETPLNRVVVKQETNLLTLHGVRNLRTLKEVELTGTMPFNFLSGVTIGNLQYLLIQSKTLDPMIQEGYIVRDSNFNRIKIKTEQYVRLSHFRDGMTRNKLLAIAIANEGSELLSYFKEYADIYTELETKYQKLVQMVEHVWFNTQDIKEQKEFALTVKDAEFSGALFQLRAGKIQTVQEYFAKINVKSVMEMIEKYYA